MPDVKLTIAIPSIPSRIRMNLQPLFSRLMNQIGDRKDVEVLSILDNKSMTIGRKKQFLYEIAQGKYTAIIDDDDDVTDDYVSEVTSAISLSDDVDVISYDQQAFIEGVPFLVACDISHPYQSGFDQLPSKPKDQFGNYIPCRRPPWNWCAWKTDIARRCFFGNSNFGEDATFVANAMKIAKTQHKIDKILHIYRWSAKDSSAPPKWDELNPPVVLR
jgi:hypothetical protein